jgi:D-amino-acid dehydrogenase
MKVAVLGAGVVGVTAAWELLRDGHEVVVVDRRPEPASETSYANAGMIAPGHAYAWSSPKALKTLLRALTRDDLALRFRFQTDLGFWRWAVRFALQCTSEKAAANTRRKVGLSLYAQERLRGVLAETGIRCGMRSEGALYLYRDPAGLAAADEKAKILRNAGVEVRRVSPEEAAALDPVYEGVKDRFAGALYAPGDESGDARLFTRELARRCAERGAEFRFGETILDFRTAGDRVESVLTDKGELAAEAFVLALGCYSAPLGKKLGLDLPVWPVKGYSVTLPLAGSNNPPRLPGVDEDNLFAFANYGDRVRLTAVAELGGWDWSHRPEDFAPMLKAAHELFPQAGDWSRPEYWAGLRPMTPNNLPILGRGRQRNLWVDTGHGHMGWTWACGTARIVADLLAGRRPEWDPVGLEPKAA